MAKEIRLTVSDEQWESLRQQWQDEAERAETAVGWAESDVAQTRAKLAEHVAHLNVLKAIAEAKRKEYRDAFPSDGEGQGG